MSRCATSAAGFALVLASILSLVGALPSAQSARAGTAVVQTGSTLGRSGLGQASSPPVVRTPPRVEGIAQAGRTLTARHGTWRSHGRLSYAYRWLRCNPNGVRCRGITKANGRRYKVTNREVGTVLRVAVTATDSLGSAKAVSAPSRIVVEAPGKERLVALWHMDETTGTVMHDSVNGHDGTLNLVAPGLPGFSATAFGFNGSSSYASVPSADDLNPGDANIILTIRLKTTSLPPPPPADADLLRKGSYTPLGSEYKMELQHSGQASCGFEGSAGYGEVIAGPALNDGQWHTIECLKTMASIELIVDGRRFSQAANIGTIANDAPVVIGARPGSDWYTGALDEASIKIG